MAQVEDLVTTDPAVEELIDLDIMTCRCLSK